MSVDIAYPLVEINDGEFSAEGITVDLSINSFAGIAGNSVLEKLGEGEAPKVIQPFGEDLLETFRKLQNDRLANKPREITMRASAGDGSDSFRFEGFIVSPTGEVGTGHRAGSLRAIHRDVLIDRLDFSIYAEKLSSLRSDEKNESSLGELKFENPTNGDVIKLLKNVSEVLVSNFKVAKDAKTKENEKEIITYQHEEVNEGSGALDQWYAILDNSDVFYKSWEELLKFESNTAGHKMSARHIVDSTIGLLTSSPSSFWATLQQVMSYFRIVYIPSIEGPGRLERADIVVKQPTQSVELSGRMISLRDGDSQLQAVGAVMIMSDLIDASRKESSGSRNYVAIYPEGGVAGGRLVKVPPPQWLMRPIGGKLSVQADGAVKLDLTKYREKIEADGEDQEKKVSKIRDVLTEYAEVSFKERQLFSSTGTVVLPLTFKWNDLIGRRVYIRVYTKMQSNQYFTGYLKAMKHELSVQNGKKMDSGTTLMFTHVKYEI